MAIRIKHFILIAVLCIIGCASAEASAAVKQVVRVGYYAIPGFHNISADGERSGYGYDFLQLVRRYTKLDFAYLGRYKTWAESLAMLERGDIDLLTGALRTPEREKKFDFSFPIGNTSINLYVHNYDMRYRAHDYASYRGMRIGTVKSEILGERLKQMASRCHFDCTIVDYEDFDKMYDAMSRHEIDAICAIGTHLVNGYRILDSFDYENIYAIVKKGNTQLLNTINDAILQMDQTVMMWPLKLFQDNYLSDNTSTLDFSDSELAYIRKHSKASNAIKIATDNTWKPYSWCENGEYHGIVVEIVDMLMKQVGLQYEFVDGEVSSESILHSRKDVDLYVDFVSNKQYAEEQGLVISPPFMTPSISIISHKSLDKLHTIGLVKNTPMLNKTAKKNYDYVFKIYPTTEDLIEAVKKDEVDGGMMYDYIAQLYVNTDDDSKMQISFIPGMTLTLHMVTRNTDDRELISIVSKCIYHMDHNNSNNIATKYLSVNEKEESIWQFMKHNPWLPVIIVFLSLSGFLLEKFRRAKAELQRQKQLEVSIAANEAKTRFLHNMSHEIRTPLNAMFGFAQLLGMPDGSCTEEEKEQYNKYIYNSYRMMEMLINDILDTADSEHGNYRIELADVNVNDICNSALQSVEFRVSGGVKLYFTTDCPDDFIIKSDERRIQQVLINYLTNACKNTHKGEIHLHSSLDEHPGMITFSVADTGPGIPPEKADLIFSRFTKLNQFVQGSGLGLNICQTIATKLGGNVYLDVKYTHGARFVFTLPLSEPQE